MNKCVIKSSNRIRSIDLKLASKDIKPATFKEGDLVWIHLRKKCFPCGQHGKWKPQANGIFKVLNRVRESAYKIKPQETMIWKITFLSSNLFLY
jgi:hypothetical protein